jgi:GntR family transcriptional regulator
MDHWYSVAAEGTASCRTRGFGHNGRQEFGRRQPILMLYNMDHTQVLLNRDDPLPLYHQLKRRLIQEIHSGRFTPDRAFPSERELVEHFQVSRMTVRLALQDLAREGWLRRERGRGSFITPRKLSRQADRLIGFAEDEIAASTPVVIRERSLRLLGATEAVPSCFTRHPACVFYRSERLGVLGDQALMYSMVHLKVPAGTVLTPAMLQEFESFYPLLERRVGITISHGSRTMEAVEARKRDAQVLNVRPKSPLLLVRTTAFDSSGDAVLHSESRFRGDRYQYVVPYIGRRASRMSETSTLTLR